MIPNKKMDDGCPCDICSSQDEISEAEPMNEFEFQNVVIDWFLKLEEEIQDLKKLIEEHE